MKKIFTVGIISLLALSSFQACTKEELITINDPLELDENSVQFQQYMEERAIQLIKKYRFDQLDNTIDRIKDPVVRQRVIALLTEYRDRAFNEALYYAKPNGDTIFFFPPNIDNRFEATRLLISNSYQKAVVNEIGVLHGFKNFPNVETVDIGNSLATGIKDLNGLPKLKTFYWTFEPYYFGQFYPEIELAPRPLTFDFSQNDKLETVNIQYVDLANLKFPVAKIQNVSLTNAIVNTGEEIDRIIAGDIRIDGASEAKDLVLTSKATDALILNLAGVSSLDMGEANIKTFSNGLGVEKIKFNEGLKKLSLNASGLKEQPTFPISIEELTVYNYPFAANYPGQLKKLIYSYNDRPSIDVDLSHLTQLEGLSIGYGTSQEYADAPNWLDFRGNTLKLPNALKRIEIGTSGYYRINVDGMEFPPSLQSIKFNIATVSAGSLDFSNVTNLKELSFYILVMNSGTIKLPPSVEKIDFSSSTLMVNALDLSQLTNLNYLNLGELGYSYQTGGIPVTLTLPLNLNESALSSVNAGRKPVILKTGSTIVNKPDWFDKYVQYL